jgi:hypothetical protein
MGPTFERPSGYRAVGSRPGILVVETHGFEGRDGFVVAICLQPSENRRIPASTRYRMSKPDFRTARNKFVARPHPVRVHYAQCDRVDLRHKYMPMARSAGARRASFFMANDIRRPRVKLKLCADIEDDLSQFGRAA